MNYFNNMQATIQAINPAITNELLDLLSECLFMRLKEDYSFECMMNKVEDDKKFTNIIKSTILKE